MISKSSVVNASGICFQLLLKHEHDDLPTVFVYIPAVLAAVTVHSHDVAHLVLQARTVLDLLLNASSEETLEHGTRNRLNGRLSGQR